MYIIQYNVVIYMCSFSSFMGKSNTVDYRYLDLAYLE